jgi:hypothetical protein
VALSRDDAAVLLNHLQSQLREQGLGDVSDRIAASIADDPTSAPGQLLRYLDALLDELRLGTDTTIREITSKLRTLTTTESGDAIGGITLELSDADRDLYGVDRLDLGVAPDLSRLIADLSNLRGAIREALIEGGWG